MLTPTIHRDGSSPEALVAALSTAHMALIRALDVLAETVPHGRDLSEHLDRMQRLHDVRAALETIVAEVIG